MKSFLYAGVIAMGLAGCSQQGEPQDAAGEGPSTADGVERVEEGNLIYENIPPIPDSLKEDLNQYQNTRSAGFEDWSSEGGIIISTRFGEVSQLHHVAMPMGARRQISFYQEPVTNALARPGGSGFLFTKDTGGDENFQIYYHDEDSGDVSLMTDGESRNESPVWAEDGSAFAYRSNRRDWENWDILVASPDAPDAAEAVYQGNNQWWFPAAFSPDGSRLLIAKYISITNTEAYLLDLATGETTRIPGDAPTALYIPMGFTQDGSGIFMISDAGTEFQTLRLYDIESDSFTPLTGDIPWNVESADISPDGRLIAFSTNENGRSELHIRTTADNQPRPVPDLPPGIVSGLEFSPDGSRLGFTFSQATSPSDAYVYNLDEGELVRWTRSEVGGLDTDTFVAPELITYESFDGLEVSAFVYTPEGDGPHPVIVSIHGGPEGQARPFYSSTYQYWVNELGAAVVVPNVRGSSGYGKTFSLLDNERKREDSVRDIGALLDWIAGQDGLDQDRIVVYGGSYGGYMVLASMTHYNDRLLGAIDIVGISNFVTFLENTAPYRQNVRRPEYGDERDPEMRAFLEDISPLNNADRITKPLLIIQGMNDPRVPASEAEQMKQIVRANGGEVWYLAARDEGHGFRKKSNRDFQAATQVLFLRELFYGDGS